MNLLSYVNPFVGTSGGGNVFPGATTPFGMIQWSPETAAGGLTMPGGYNYGDSVLRGFSLTHLSGAGCAAFGNISFMSTAQRITTAPEPNGSPYSKRFAHRDERASPGFYSVRLGTGIRTELAATRRTGIARFTFPHIGRSSILLDAGAGAGPRTNVDGAARSTVTIAGTHEVTGWATGGHFCGLHNTYTVYLVAQFSQPFSSFGVWQGPTLRSATRHSQNARSGAYLSFDTHRGEVLVKVGISYVNVRGAQENLRLESPGWDLRAVRAKASAMWKRLLVRIWVSGGTARDKRTFYTALYHAVLHPNVFSDVDGRYRGFDGRSRIARGRAQYANFSGWDIYSTQIPLLAWLVPWETSDMMQSLVADANEGGRLPKWPVANASVEGNAAQYSWAVPQNVKGLLTAMGGARPAGPRLDSLFERLNAGPTQSHYWAGNEPGLWIPWEYVFLQRPWGTQKVVRRIMTSLYRPAPAGLPGNDDLGTLSAWYVWASLGLYPEIPGVGGFVIGRPLFQRAVIEMGKGYRLQIVAPAASENRPYVTTLRVSGKPYRRTWLAISDISGNIELRFSLAARPDRRWGTGVADAPPSFP